MSTVLYVCTTCRRAGFDDDPEGTRPGARLCADLTAKGMPDGVELRPHECLSACKTGCSVALQSPGKWTYVYGFMDPDADHASEIIAGAAAYAASADGLVPWRERPTVFRKQSIARVPPLVAGPPKL